MTKPRKSPKNPGPAKMGRPTDYSPSLAAEICTRIVETGSLRQALAKDDMPGERTVYRWLAENEDFRHTYMICRDHSTEADSEEMRRIAYDPAIKADDKRVMVDVLKWQMARRSSKKWGDRLDVQHGGTVNLTFGEDDAGCL